MFVQPIIIQVLSGSDRRAINFRVNTLGLSIGILLLLALHTAVNSGQQAQTVLITGTLVLVLIGNAILIFRNKMVDRCSKSLYFDGGRCYTMTKSGSACNQSPAYLYHKREMLSIRSAEENKTSPQKTLVFQVLDQEDWKAIKELSAQRSGDNKNPIVGRAATFSPADHVL